MWGSRMRNLVIRFVLWLCRRFEISLLDEQRRYMGADEVARSQRWESFYLEQGGLADMIAELRREAFEVAAELDPRDTDLIYYWATSDRNARRLEQKVRSVIANGKIAAKRAEVLGDTGNPRKSI